MKKTNWFIVISLIFGFFIIVNHNESSEIASNIFKETPKHIGPKVGKVIISGHDYAKSGIIVYKHLECVSKQSKTLEYYNETIKSGNYSNKPDKSLKNTINCYKESKIISSTLAK